MIEKLKEYNEMLFKKQYNINLLHWELMLEAPSKATDYLISLINDLQIELFKLGTSSEYKKLLEEYLNDINTDKTSDFFRANKYNYEILLKSERIPEDFLKRYNEVCSKTNKVWEEAKNANDYEMYKPYLKKVIEVTKEYYSYYEPEMNLYDAMLNVHEQGMTQEKIDKLFEELKLELIPLIKKVKNNNTSSTETLMHFSHDQLMECAKVLLEYIGFDMSRGALGIYPHGFMEKMFKNDIRIAFKHTDSPTSFVSTIIHEGGHGLFEQNMKEEIATWRPKSVNDSL